MGRKDTRSAAVSVSGLTKRYDGPEGEVRALDGVSFRIDPGQVVGILGPNGAGKTTLIKSMLGLIVPTEGDVVIDEITVTDDSTDVYSHAGAMLEGARNIYWRLTVRENLEFFATLAGHSPDAVRDRHDELLELFGLTEKADVAVRELSRGMKQKVSLATTLSRGCSVLFLDEPTLGLDVESSLELRRELRRLVDRQSLTVVLSSHDMDVIESLCDRIIVLNDGRIVADSTIEELTAIFESQAYDVTMNEPLPEGVRRSIERTHTVEQWTQTADGKETFTVVLARAELLYDLVETLEESGRVIESIDSTDPDLETAFLEITGQKTDEPSAATGEEGTRQRADDGQPSKKDVTARRQYRPDDERPSEAGGEN